LDTRNPAIELHWLSSWLFRGKLLDAFEIYFLTTTSLSNVRKIRCVFFGGFAAEKHTLVLFEAAGGGLKKNILFRTRY